MKIIWGFILIILSFTLGVANDYAIIENDNRKGLIDQKGNILIPPIYDDLGWSEGGSSVVEDIIGYKTGDYWGLITTKNIKITLPNFIKIFPFDKNHLIASKADSYKLNEIYGLVTLSGKTVIDFKYTYLHKSDLNLIAGLKSKGKLYFGVIDTRGKTIIPFLYREIDIVSKDMYALKDTSNNILLVNNSGKSIVHLEIDEIEPLNEYLYVYSREGKKGIIQRNGLLVTTPAYEKIMLINQYTINAFPTKKWQIVDFNNNNLKTLDYDLVQPIDKSLYKTRRNNYSFIINEKEEEVFKIKDSDIQILNDSLAAISKNGRYGVINYKGEMILPPAFDSIRINEGNLFLYQQIQSNSFWLIADLSGTLLSAETYDEIYSLNEKYHAVKKNGFWGITDRNGMEKIPPIYDTIYYATPNFYLIGFHGEIGVVDVNRQWRSLPRKGDLYILDDRKYLVSTYNESKIISFNGEEIYHSENYLHPVSNSFIEENFKHQFGIINRDYKQVLPAVYDSVAEIKKDSIFLFKNGNGWGAVDHKGQVLFKDDNRFEEVLGCTDDFIGVKIDGEYGFVDLFGRLRIANRYKGVDLFNEGLANINIRGKWGCINEKEIIVIQPYYDKKLYFLDGLAIAQKDGKYGIIDNNGKIKITFEYDRIERVYNGGFICILNNNAGLINKEGILKFYPKFDQIVDLQNNFVLVKRKNKFGLMNSNGVIKIPIIHDEMFYDPINEVILVSNKQQWERLIVNFTK